MITKHSKKGIKLANEFELDYERCAVNADPINGTIVLSEFDYFLDGYVTNDDMKKLAAMKIFYDTKKKRYTREYIGELDYTVVDAGKGSYLKVNDYAAKNKEVLEQLFKFLENRAIAKGARMIDMVNYSYKPLSFLKDFGYVCYAEENHMISAWAKNNLKEQKFNTTLEQLKKSIQPVESQF